MKTLKSFLVLGLMVGTLFAEGVKEQKEMEIQGEIVKVDEVSEQALNMNVLRIQVRTRAEEMTMAHLGPAWSLGTDLKKGDQVTLRARVEEENRLMVREMVCNKTQYRIRDENYSPLWLKTRLREEKCFYNPQKEKLMKGKIEEMYAYEPSLVLEAKVKSQDGETMNVRFAPEWYLESRMRIGDEIELRGSEVKSDARMMILAREMRNLRTHQEIALRNGEGFPLWKKTGEGSGDNKTGRIGTVGKKEGVNHGKR